jgi:hypothetical protein
MRQQLIGHFALRRTKYLFPGWFRCGIRAECHRDGEEKRFHDAQFFNSAGKKQLRGLAQYPLDFLL